MKPWAPALLLIVGLAQMAGDALHILPLKAIAAATAASPAPKVFTSIGGMEPFSTRFVLEWEDIRGVEHEFLVTPEAYARLAGPYNRRNVYGAVMAAGPILANDSLMAPMFRAVASHALCDRAPLLRELGFDSHERAGPLRLRYEPRPGPPSGVPLRVSAPCA